MSSSRSPFSRRTWLSTAHLVLNLPAGVMWFSSAVALVAAGAGLSITLIGIPLLALAVRWGRTIGHIERWRAQHLLGANLSQPPLLGPCHSLAGLRAALVDKFGWRGLLYGVISLPRGIVTFTFVVVSWSIAIAASLFPLYFWFIPETATSGPFRFSDTYVLLGWGRLGYTVGLCAVGLALLWLTPRLVDGLAAADRRLMKVLLSGDSDWPRAVAPDAEGELSSSSSLPTPANRSAAHCVTT